MVELEHLNDNIETLDAIDDQNNAKRARIRVDPMSELDPMSTEEAATFYAEKRQKLVERLLNLHVWQMKNWLRLNRC